MSSRPPTEVSLQRAGPITGEFRVPGDKSISHRAAIIGAIADGTTEITGFVRNLDCDATLACIATLGATVEQRGPVVRVDGGSFGQTLQEDQVLDARNSGTTLRLLAGAIASRPLVVTLTGDESLCRRPMGRIKRPLELMGATVDTTNGNPPITVRGVERPDSIDYDPGRPSAQVKSAVLLAGLAASGRTIVRERIRTRDHTERMLRLFGADVGSDRDRVWVEGPARLSARRLDVPGDFSSAAFLIALGLLVPGSRVVLRDVGLNPTRTRLLDIFHDIGADIDVTRNAPDTEEPVGDIVVRYTEQLSARDGRFIEIGPELVAEIIDEVPILAIVGSQAAAGIRFVGARDLRHKESDRIAALAEGLARMGADVRATEDTLEVGGKTRLEGARIRSWGDHRIVMAFACAALIADGQTVIESPEAASVSFPDFFRNLPEGSVAWTSDVSC